MLSKEYLEKHFISVSALRAPDGVARDSPTQAGTRRNTDGAAEGDVGGGRVAVRLVGIGALSLLLPESAGRRLIPRDAPLETATFHLKDVSRGGETDCSLFPFQGLRD